jgi:hypothetical protein
LEGGSAGSFVLVGERRCDDLVIVFQRYYVVLGHHAPSKIIF